jgi:hypothetical protein
MGTGDVLMRLTVHCADICSGAAALNDVLFGDVYICGVRNMKATTTV